MTESATVDVARRRRVIRRFDGDAPGPTLIVVGGIHGNEPAGLMGIDRVATDLARDPIAAGDVCMLTGNIGATAAGCRFVDEDLNRIWIREMMARPADSAEARERDELVQALEAATARARGPVYLLDLHTTSGDSTPFAVFADSLPSREFARNLGIPIVLGFEEHLQGTLLDYVADIGHPAVLVEGGAHGSPDAPENLAAATWIALARTGLVSAERAEVRSATARLGAVTGHLPAALEVRYRHAIGPQDAFIMHPGFASFDAVRRGQMLGKDRRGAVRAEEEGMLLLPLYQPLGDDGFFIARRVRPFWLAVSRWLRSWRLDRVVSYLPGVKPDPSDPKTIVVNTRIARWFALQVFHLLGFKRTGVGRYELRMTRRRDEV